MSVVSAVFRNKRQSEFSIIGQRLDCIIVFVPVGNAIIVDSRTIYYILTYKRRYGKFFLYFLDQSLKLEFLQKADKEAKICLITLYNGPAFTYKAFDGNNSFIWNTTNQAPPVWLGCILSYIQTIPVQNGVPSRRICFDARVDWKIAMHENCKLKKKRGREALLSCLAQNRHLLRYKRQS